jgi:hypothetical protein
MCALRARKAMMMLYHLAGLLSFYILYYEVQATLKSFRVLRHSSNLSLSRHLEQTYGGLY